MARQTSPLKSIQKPGLRDLRREVSKMCSDELSQVLHGPEDATLEERIAGARLQVVRFGLYILSL